MIQRIQTVYLFLALIISGSLPFVFSIWTNSAKQEVYASSNLAFIGLFEASALLSFIAIISFAKRQNQFVLNRLNMILNFILIGLLSYYSLTLSGEAQVSEKGIGMLLPIFSIILLVLANKAIKKDEDLVKSVDRIR